MLRWAEFSAEGRAAREAFDREVRLPGRAAFECGDAQRAVLLLTGGIAGVEAAARIAPEAMRRRMENERALRMLTLSTDEFPWFAPRDVAGVLAPTLLLAGEKTPPIHAAVFRNLCDVMRQAEVHRIPDAGHGVARDNPAAFNRLVLDFLARQGCMAGTLQA